MIGVLQPIQPLVGNTNQLIRLFAVEWKRRDAVIHAHRDAERDLLQRFREYRFDTSAERKRLIRIRLRQQHREFISANTKRGVRSTQRLLQSRRRRAQYLVAAGVAVLV